IDTARSADDVVAERHRGIRPAFRYPACPDHSEKFKLFDLLGAHEAGLSLTEHAAMLPAASVSGLYFGNPRARYFTVGRIGDDQVADYARRKGRPIEAVEAWLTANLAYTPSATADRQPLSRWRRAATCSRRSTAHSRATRSCWRRGRRLREISCCRASRAAIGSPSAPPTISVCRVMASG